MIVAERSEKSKCTPEFTARQWAQEQGRTVVPVLLDQLPPAVRQAWGTLEDMERGTRSLLQCLGQQFMEQMLTTIAPRPMGLCQRCGAPLRTVEPERERGVLGVFGEYPLQRAYGVCPQGHGSDVPVDRQLGLGPDHASPLLSRILARLAIEVPFEQVADVVEETLGLTLDPERARRIAERLGTWAEEQERAQIAAALSETTPEPDGSAPHAVVIGLDGAMVHTKRNGQNGWHEGKIGVCATIDLESAADAPVTARLGPRDFCVGFESREQFFPRLYAHAVGLGLDTPSCQNVVVIGDGAHWIWELTLRFAPLDEGSRCVIPPEDWRKEGCPFSVLNARSHLE